jgi:predicted membrane protein
MKTDSIHRENKFNLLSLLVAMSIMIGATAYPLLLVNDDGHANHLMAVSLFWAMSAGFIHGIGFVPRTTVWKWSFSGNAVLVTLSLTLFLKFINYL